MQATDNSMETKGYGLFYTRSSSCINCNFEHVAHLLLPFLHHFKRFIYKVCMDEHEADMFRAKYLIECLKRYNKPNLKLYDSHFSNIQENK